MSHVRVLVLMCFTVSLLAASLGSTATLGLSPSILEVEPHDVFSLDLRIGGLGAGTAPALGGFDVEIHFDSTLIEYHSTAFGDPGLGDQLALGGFGSVTSAGVSANTISLFGLSLAPTPVLESAQASDFVLARIEFKALMPGATGVEISGLSLLGDAHGNAIPIDHVENALVAVVPEPAAALCFGLGLVFVARALEEPLRRRR